MNKVNIKERRKIYKDAANALFLKNSSVCCEAIFNVSGLPSPNTGFSSYKKFPVVFPEFGLFEPEIKWTFGRWWDDNDIDSRINAMLFCYHIANESIKENGE